MLPINVLEDYLNLKHCSPYRGRLSVTRSICSSVTGSLELPTLKRLPSYCNKRPESQTIGKELPPLTEPTKLIGMIAYKKSIDINFSNNDLIYNGINT